MHLLTHVNHVDSPGRKLITKADRASSLSRRNCEPEKHLQTNGDPIAKNRNSTWRAVLHPPTTKHQAGLTAIVAAGFHSARSNNKPTPSNLSVHPDPGPFPPRNFLSPALSREQGPCLRGHSLVEAASSTVAVVARNGGEFPISGCCCANQDSLEKRRRRAVFVLVNFCLFDF